MNNSDIKPKPGNTHPSFKCDNEGNIIDFGGWESEREKLKNNLTWTPEQILNWLEEANQFTKEIRESRDVLRGNHQ